jgi:hypothetical protein
MSETIVVPVASSVGAHFNLWQGEDEKRTRRGREEDEKRKRRAARHV